MNGSPAARAAAAAALRLSIAAGCGRSCSPAAAPVDDSTVTVTETSTGSTSTAERPRRPRQGHDDHRGRRAPPPADIQVTDSTGFTSPTGNIGCYIDRAASAATSASATGIRRPGPTSCNETRLRTGNRDARRRRAGLRLRRRHRARRRRPASLRAVDRRRPAPLRERRVGDDLHATPRPAAASRSSSQPTRSSTGLETAIWADIPPSTRFRFCRSLGRRVNRWRALQVLPSQPEPTFADRRVPSVGHASLKPPALSPLGSSRRGRRSRPCRRRRCRSPSPSPTFLRLRCDGCVDAAPCPPGPSRWVAPSTVISNSPLKTM